MANFKQTRHKFKASLDEGNSNLLNERPHSFPGEIIAILPTFKKPFLQNKLGSILD